jgi:L-seryl-tRNA(Ser) seleniumtransferase
MTPQELWGSLPSIAELSAHPRVREVVERVNRSQALARVRTAVEDLAAEAARRAERWQGLGPSDLIELVLKKLERGDPAASVAAINATGELWGPTAGSAPLADAALDALVRQSSCYTKPADRSETGAERTLRELAGAERGLVTPSLAMAVAATLEAFAAESAGSIVVARNEVAEVDDGVRLSDLCRDRGIAIVEVGDAHRVGAEDYSRACAELRERGATHPAVYRRLAETYAVVGGDQRLGTAAIVAAIGASKGVLLEDLAGAPPCEGLPSLGIDSGSAQRSIREEATAVLLRGDGFLGGPRSGIVLGGAPTLAAIRARLDATVVGGASSAIVDALLAATAELFRDPAKLPFTHPLWGLVDTPLENLRTRAERLAPQIAAGQGGIATEVVAINPAECRPRGLVRLASWGIALTPKQGSAMELAEALAAGTTRVLAPVREGRVVLDLRTVFPRQDAALVLALGGLAQASRGAAGPRIG